MGYVFSFPGGYWVSGLKISGCATVDEASCCLGTSFDSKFSVSYWDVHGT